MEKEREKDSTKALSSPWIAHECKEMEGTSTSQDRALSKPMRIICTSTAITAGFLSTCEIYQYSLIVNKAIPHGRIPYQKIQTYFLTHLPKWFLTPSPAIATIAWAIFTLSAATILHLHRNDKYQNRILAATIILGILGYSVLSETRIEEALATQIPGWIGLGLMLSMAGHIIVNGKEERKTRLEREREEETNGSDLDLEKS